MELDSWSKQHPIYCLPRLARLWTSLFWLPVKQKGKSNQNACFLIPSHESVHTFFRHQVMNQCTLSFIIKSWISAHFLLSSSDESVHTFFRHQVMNQCTCPHPKSWISIGHTHHYVFTQRTCYIYSYYIYTLEQSKELSNNGAVQIQQTHFTAPIYVNLWLTQCRNETGQLE